MSVMTHLGTSTRALLAAGVAGIALASTAALAQDGEPIRIGILEDQSGEFAAATIQKVHGAQLAAAEINEAGGIMGRPIELVIYDPQSDNRRYQELMRRILQRDQVDVVFAGFSSASREAVRPIVNQFDALYFYTNQYEGGVCDANVVATGAVPEQQFSTLVPWMMEEFGPRVYTIAADYNFGQISAEWVRQLVEEGGGEMVGEEFIPLGVSQFSQTIQNIQEADPDVLMTLLVGTAQASFYEQAAAANLDIPMGSSVNVAQGYEHLRFDPPALSGMHVTANYIEEVDTPASRDFIERWRAMFPDEVYINQPGQNSYVGIYLYAAAVEMAGSTDMDAVRAAIQTGDVCVDAPEGQVCIDPASQHASHTIYLAVVGEDHSITIPQVWENIEPYWLGEAGCDLTVRDHDAQYTPSNPPPAE
ncbi:MAG: urea ABC transporter substrate-binding protein [Rhodospirillaceae bacterium]|nr:urea ABC transporter substrate-binding protein [Rhodospirillaceae bacterium]MCA8933896.1 urea ABC transporter substrate-binding protein [Rhodospirillaceae bacterium]